MTLSVFNTKNLYDTKSRPDPFTQKPGSASARQKGEKVRKDKQGGSWSWFFFKVLLFVVVAGGGYVGYTAWRTQQRRSHRF